MRKTKRHGPSPQITSEVLGEGFGRIPSFCVSEVTNMAIGAILITTGCGSAPRILCGGITVAQRMIASLQKSGVAIIVVVTGSEDKKLEKQLAQFGVFFVHNHTPEQESLSVQLGLNFRRSQKCRQ